MQAARNHDTIDILDGFKQFAEGRKELIMETYYRRLRRRENVLMDGAKPVEGRWNFDADNREKLPSDAGATRPIAKALRA